MISLRACQLAVLALALAFAAPLASSKTLRWTSQGDILTMDPHSQNEGLNNAVSDLVYEPLVARDRQLRVEPCLALSWSQVDANTMRFKLRPGVKFSDGTPFTADDVVFSIERALQPTSKFTAYTTGITGAKRVDELTVDILTKGPNPVLIQQMTELRVMSRAWAVKNKVEKPQDYVNKEETFAARNAMGTGQYLLVSRQADVQTTFTKNPNWWGIAAGNAEGNIEEVVYLPIKSDATRVAALLSGEIDFLLDPPPQDIPRLKANANIKVLEGNENRTIFFGFDQLRDELVYGSVKNRNPFKDLRVRQAFYHAIDSEAIKTKVMRGLALPTGSIIAPQVHGYSQANDKRLPPDREKARRLLAEAGYPNGFEVTVDCPNNRYINDEEICQAVAAMLAQVGVTVKVNAMPRTLWTQKTQKYDTSFYMLGWGVPTFDALYSLYSLAHTITSAGDGNFNLGRYSNPKMDALIDRIKVETDPKARDQAISDALALHHAEVVHLPLHHQVIPWAMNAKVSAVHRADNRLTFRWVSFK